MSKQKYISIAIFTVLILCLASCSESRKPDNESIVTEVLPDDIVELREDQQKLVNIETGNIEFRSLGRALKVNGMVTVAPQNLATVCFPMGGFVKSTTLIPGNAVKKGQKLAIIENQDFIDVQQNYLEVKNKLEYAEAEYNRHSELYKDDVSSQKNFQEVTANYKSLNAELKALEQKLSLIGINPSDLLADNISRTVNVIAPISGYIKTVNVNLGKYVAPSDVLFEIVNSDNLLLELMLFEKDADKVAPDQKIHFFVNNETEQHEAVVYETGKSIGSDNTLKVFAKVTGTCKNVLPGMYINALIHTSDNKVTSLPSDAIVSFDDVDYIFVFVRNKEEGGKPFTEYRMIKVKKGVTDGNFTEVILPEGFDIYTNVVVIKGAYNLLSAKKNAGEMAC